MAKITLILGGARSGKSLYAEQLALSGTGTKIYLATAQAHDAEMEKRIEIHKKRRSEGWETVEEPLDIAKIISGNQQPVTILVDCLTLWLSNLLHKEMDIPKEIDSLVDALKSTGANVILVSNEIGFGIVPENILAREFRDFAGLLHQMVAFTANEVVMVVAGIPVKIKG